MKKIKALISVNNSVKKPILFNKYNKTIYILLAQIHQEHLTKKEREIQYFNHLYFFLKTRRYLEI